jgi:glycosyltransferase involved in cell wall biosynthesis
MKLSVAIIAYNEERHIGACLASVAGVADEIIVLDSGSHDQTVAISRSAGACVYVEPWRGFPAQRNRMLELCAGEWVFFIDADERLTDELRQELSRLKGAPQVAGYWIPRYNLFFGQRLRGGGWYPDHQLRLLRRGYARYDEGRVVHEVVQLQGEAAYCTGHLLHLNIERLGEFWQKQARYAFAEARTLHAEGRRFRWRNLVGAPTREFYRRYIQLGGWRDGPLGLFLCGTLAWFEVVKFTILRVL